VEALHQVGIIHGALHARNIIIDPSGRPHLTHVSPLLFHDPVADEAALCSMITSLVDHRPDIDPSLSAALTAPGSLRELASRLVSVDAPQSGSVGTDAEDQRRRRGTLVLAVAVALAGLIAAATVALLSSRI